MNKEFDLKKCFECMFIKSFERDFTDRDKVDLLQLTKNELVDIYITAHQCFRKYHRYGEIKFAIAELEKLKDYLSGQFMLITKSASELDRAEAKGCNDVVENIRETIDNQIKVLRENA